MNTVFFFLFECGGVEIGPIMSSGLYLVRFLTMLKHFCHTTGGAMLHSCTTPVLSDVDGANL